MKENEKINEDVITEEDTKQEVSVETEGKKEGFFTKIKSKCTMENAKKAGKILVIGAVAGALGYICGKNSSDDSYDETYDCDWKEITPDDDNESSSESAE